MLLLYGIIGTMKPKKTTKITFTVMKTTKGKPAVPDEMWCMDDPFERDQDDGHDPFERDESGDEFDF